MAKARRGFYNRGMRRIAALLVLTAALLSAADRTAPRGHAENESVTLDVALWDLEKLRDTFTSDFQNQYVVAEITLTPKAAAGLDLRLDDFLLRSDTTGDHTGPMSAYQIAGTGGLVLKTGQQQQEQNQPKKKKTRFSLPGIGSSSGPGMPPPPATANNTTAEMDSQEEENPLLKLVKEKVPAEGHVAKTVTGLLFFPLENEKPKNLELIYTTATGKVRLRFK